jgi:hypothetical protein
MGNWRQCWGIGGRASVLGRSWVGSGCVTAGLLQGNVIRLLVLARWWGGGIVTALAQACWCQRGRDPTIITRWKGGGGRGEGDAQHHKQHNKEPGSTRLGQKLSKRPRDLYVLWREFDAGLDGGKAVRDFTSSERGANQYAYS